MSTEPRTTGYAKGKREIFRGLEEGTIERIVIASDTDKLFRKKILSRAREYGVPCEIALTCEELRLLCGIEVPCGALGYKKQLSLSCDKGSLSK